MVPVLVFIKSNQQKQFLIVLGSIVRQRVVNHLRKKFDTLEDAEEEYGLSIDSYLGVSELPDSDQELENVHPDMLKQLDCLSGKQLVAVAVKALTRIKEEQIVELLSDRFKSCSYDLLLKFTNQLVRKLPSCNREKLLDELFLTLANETGITTNPLMFVSNSPKGMKFLQDNGKPNLISKWSRCIWGPDGKPKLDIHRMPFGLIEYQIEFFSCTNVNQVIMSRILFPYIVSFKPW